MAMRSKYVRSGKTAARLRRATEIRRFHRRVKHEVRKEVERNFRKRSGPSGKWPRRAPETRKRGQTLGRLIAANAYTVHADGVHIENQAPFSAVHQRGGRGGNRSTIPQRVFLYVREKWVRNDYRKRLMDWLLEGKSP